jgi:hypothetical protein
LFAFESDASPVAVDIDFEDRGVMDEAVDGGQRHGGIADHCRVPLFRIERCLELPSLIPNIRFTVSGLI